MAVLAAWAFARAALQHRRRAGEQSNQSDRHRRAGVSLVRDGQGALALRRLYFTKENTNTGAAASCGELDADRPVAGLVRFRLDRPRGNAGRPSAKQGADYILTLPVWNSRGRFPVRSGRGWRRAVFRDIHGHACRAGLDRGNAGGRPARNNVDRNGRRNSLRSARSATKPASIAQRPAPTPGESLSSTCSDRWTAR